MKMIPKMPEFILHLNTNEILMQVSNEHPYKCMFVTISYHKLL